MYGVKFAFALIRVSIGFCLQVRKRPLNKKGLARNEEDIIETVSNSLVVHETKLKVDLTEHLEQHEFVFDAVLKEEVSNDEGVEKPIL